VVGLFLLATAALADAAREARPGALGVLPEMLGAAPVAAATADAAIVEIASAHPAS